MLKKIKIVLYSICLIIIVVAGWNLWSIYSSTKNSTELYDKLAQQAHAEDSTAEQWEYVDTEEEEVSYDPNVSSGFDPVINPWIMELQKQNKELVGWISIADTRIDYPVMQTDEDTDFYLSHDFEKKKENHGTPYLDVNCKVDKSDNLVIYGHNMKDGTMFHDLLEYRNADFCTQNGLIRFDTPEESGQYQVAFVMLISVKEAEEFPYHQAIKFENEESFNDYLQKCEKYAVWSSTQKPVFGAKLLTLSTCEYTKNNGRLVVVAQQVKRNRKKQ